MLRRICHNTAGFLAFWGVIFTAWGLVDLIG